MTYAAMLFATLLGLVGSAHSSGSTLDVQRPPASQGSVSKGEVWMQTSLAALHADVTWSMQHQKVVLKWGYEAPGGEQRFSMQSELVSFWPTEVASFGPGRLLVTGKDSQDGATVVEHWEFDMPSALPASVLTPALSIPVESRRTVARYTDRGPVRVLWKLQGVANAGLVQFWGDPDLYRMNVANGALTKVLASAPEGSLTVVPELVTVRGSRWSRWHSTEGYIYYLGEVGSEGLLLFDADLDGTLDGIEVLSSVQFRARGLHQALDYLAFH